MSNNPFPLPAFPLEYAHYDGMTLRDYFAGQALAGMTTHYRRKDGVYENGMHPDTLAKDAYAVASAMLVARETEGEG